MKSFANEKAESSKEDSA